MPHEQHHRSVGDSPEYVEGIRCAGVANFVGLRLADKKGAVAQVPTDPVLNFDVVPTSDFDAVVIPPEHSAQVLYAYGDPIAAGLSPFSNSGTEPGLEFDHLYEVNPFIVLRPYRLLIVISMGGVFAPDASAHRMRLDKFGKRIQRLTEERAGGVHGHGAIELGGGLVPHIKLRVTQQIRAVGTLHARRHHE